MGAQLYSRGITDVGLMTPPHSYQFFQKSAFGPDKEHSTAMAYVPQRAPPMRSCDDLSSNAQLSALLQKILRRRHGELQEGARSCQRACVS